MTKSVYDTTMGLTSSLYTFISNSVVSMMKDKKSREVIVAAVIMGAVSMFRLNPVGFVASAVLPMMVNHLISTYEDEKLLKDIAAESLEDTEEETQYETSSK